MDTCSPFRLRAPRSGEGPPPAASLPRVSFWGSGALSGGQLPLGGRRQKREGVSTGGRGWKVMCRQVRRWERCVGSATAPEQACLFLDPEAWPGDTLGQGAPAVVLAGSSTALCVLQGAYELEMSVPLKAWESRDGSVLRAVVAKTWGLRADLAASLEFGGVRCGLLSPSLALPDSPCASCRTPPGLRPSPHPAGVSPPPGGGSLLLHVEPKSIL